MIKNAIKFFNYKNYIKIYLYWNYIKIFKIKKHYKIQKIWKIPSTFTSISCWFNKNLTTSTLPEWTAFIKQDPLKNVIWNWINFFLKQNKPFKNWNVIEKVNFNVIKNIFFLEIPFKNLTIKNVIKNNFFFLKWH